MASNASMISSFIESAPPGELSDVVTDIQGLTSNDPNILASQQGAFKKYNEEQFTTVKLPGGSQDVIISPYNSLDDGRYYDTASQTSFQFDHTTQKASGPQSHVQDSKHSDLIKSLLKSLSAHTAEHYPASSFGVYPTEEDSKIAIVVVANKYSPSNFWNGRWRSQYVFDVGSGSLSGIVNVDVHYYEDGNVRMLTDKELSAPLSSAASGADIVKQIASLEKRYQEDLNRAFTNLSEGAFKGLRRQLPVTRQKVEWDKIGGYRLGQDIGGGRQR